MNKIRKLLAVITVLLLIPIVSANAYEQAVYSEGYFLYHISDGYVSLCGYFGNEETVRVPEFIGGQPMSRIESGAFEGCDTVRTVILPSTVMEVQEGAFSGSSITSVVGYQGNSIIEAEDAMEDAEITETLPESPEGQQNVAPTKPVFGGSDIQTSDNSERIGEVEYFESSDPEQASLENKRNLDAINGILNKETEPENETASHSEEAGSETTQSNEPQELAQPKGKTTQSALWFAAIAACAALGIGLHGEIGSSRIVEEKQE